MRQSSVVRRAVPEQGYIEPRRRQPSLSLNAGFAGRLAVPRNLAPHDLRLTCDFQCDALFAASAKMKGFPQARREAVPSLDASQAVVDCLFQSEAPRLRRYFRQKTGDREGAADLVQDAFLKMAEAPLAEIRNPAAYLQRIARNLVVDWVRSRKVKSRSEHISLDECDASVPPHQEELYLFERAISGLSQKTRTVFLLKRVEGLTYEQIGKRLGISAKTVEYHMKQAFTHISRFLEGQ